MFSNALQMLLQQRLRTVPRIVSGRSLRLDIDELVAMEFAAGKLAVIDDAHTSAAYGDTVWRALKGRFDCERITLAAHPAADMRNVEDIRHRSGSCDALIAVGSGTVSDLCKYASHADGKAYAIFPTAASMNGYLSANASITVEGYKKTLPAHMPRAVFCDMGIIAAAPARLGKSGLGDCLARPTAQADWLLSHLLLATPYDELPFQLLAELEPQLFDAARGIAKGDMESIELLVQLLLLSGIGMTIAGGSYPASQGEHMIAHAYEMRAAGAPHSFHGEQIGVTAGTMARLQEQMLRSSPALAPLAFPAEALQGAYGETVTENAKAAYRLKRDAIAAKGLDNERLRAQWDAVCQRVAAVMLAPARIEAVLRAAAAPVLPQELGWTPDLYKEVAGQACFLRERFTFLDLNPG